MTSPALGGAIPAISDPALPKVSSSVSPAVTSSSNSSSSSVHGGELQAASASSKPRPRLLSRRSSGTIIVPRDSPQVELKEGDEIFDDDDARAMSPRRNSADLERMSQEAREQLQQCAPLSLIHLLFKLKTMTNSKKQACKTPSRLSTRNIQSHRSCQRRTRQAGF